MTPTLAMAAQKGQELISYLPVAVSPPFPLHMCPKETMHQALPWSLQSWKSRIGPRQRSQARCDWYFFSSSKPLQLACWVFWCRLVYATPDPCLHPRQRVTFWPCQQTPGCSSQNVPWSQLPTYPSQRPSLAGEVRASTSGPILAEVTQNTSFPSPLIWIRQFLRPISSMSIKLFSVVN